MTTTDRLPPIQRPNGQTYRPRKIIAYPVTDDDDALDGVIVFGTHDHDRAKSLADRAIAVYVDDTLHAVNPAAVWWRDTYCAGRRQYETDDVHGRAGIYFEADYRPVSATA